MTYAGGSGKQDFDAGSQRNKVYRAVDESRHHQVPCPPQGKEAAKLYLSDHPRVAEEIDKKIREMVASGKKLPKEIGEEEKEE